MDTSEDFIGELVGLPDAARLLDLHRATVNDMVITGRLRGYRLGAHWYVRRSDLEIFKRGYKRPKGSPRRKTAASRFFWTSEILRWLLHWEDATSSELDHVLDLHVGNIRKYLAIAEHDGYVARDDCGSWRLTTEGRAVAERLPIIEDQRAS